MLPIQQKPSTKYNYSDFIVEIPNVLSTEQINRLKAYALNETDSGLHRRGSKDKYTLASFYTCQVFRTDDEIYSILDPLWDDYKSQLTFIEPYEIKSYVEGDEFEYHTDSYFNLDLHTDRKLNLIIQMSDRDEYDGGELCIGDYVCSKEKGTAILFPAMIYHCVTPITRGSRFSLIGHGWGPYDFHM